MSLSLRVRELSVAASFSVAKLLETPELFFQLLEKRFGSLSKVFRLLAPLASATFTRDITLRKMMQLGRFEEAQAHIELMSRWNKATSIGHILLLSRYSNQLGRSMRSRPLVAKGSASRVLMLLNSVEPFTRSGYTVRSAGIVSALHSQVDELTVVARFGYPAVIGKFVDKKYDEMTEFQMPRFFPFSENARFKASVSSLRTICIDKNVTILHTTTNFGNAQVVSEVASLLGIPWVYELRGEPHNTWLSKVPPQDRPQAKASKYYNESQNQELRAAKAATAVVVLSEISKRKLIEHGVEEDRIAVVSNGIPNEFRGDAELSAKLSKQFNLPAKPLLGAISALVGYEGIETLITALEFLPSEVHLVIVGDGEEKERLMELATSRGFGDRVTFTGHRPAEEMPGWYQLIDLLVVPRRDLEVCRSVTPIKALQAQAVGTPVLASDLPALREVTGGFARFFTAEDPAALADAAIGVLREPERWCASTEWIASRSWNEQVENLVQLYHKLLDVDDEGRR